MFTHVVEFGSEDVLFHVCHQGVRYKRHIQASKCNGSTDHCASCMEIFTGYGPIHGCIIVLLVTFLKEHCPDSGSTGNAFPKALTKWSLPTLSWSATCVIDDTGSSRSFRVRGSHQRRGSFVKS
jgi:hypothetical protein